ncbi:DUF4206 domain-containing protein [Aphelenchoides besseyi]|nr:DUF4206 domain-containing protein [Aphelenchoides besseyi]
MLITFVDGILLIVFSTAVEVTRGFVVHISGELLSIYSESLVNGFLMNSEFYVQPLTRTKSFDILNTRLVNKSTHELKREVNVERNSSNRSHESSNVETNLDTKTPVGRQTETVHLLLSEMLIQTAELNSWSLYTKDIDFSTDPGPISQQSNPYCQSSNTPSTSTAIPQRYRASSSTSFCDLELNSTSEASSAEHSDVEESEDPAAEKVVQSLLRHFKKKLTVNGKDLVYLVTEVDNQQDTERISDLLTSWCGSKVFPQEWQISNNLTVTDDWAPPKREFIYDLQETDSDLATLIHQQKDQCAGCRRSLQPSTHGCRALYCHYFNKVFCPVCHQGSKARIPARILHQWNFKAYAVCDLAYNFLHEIEDQPVFDIHALDTKLNRRISHIWQYIRLCPSEVITKYGLLRTMFESVPSRFLSLEYVDVYSLLDFERIENGNLIEMLEPLKSCGISHVVNCDFCKERGFLCQICRSPQVLFPFQEKIYRCEGCGALSHLRCYTRQMQRNQTVFCDRCKRIHQKRSLLMRTFGFARPFFRRVWSRIRQRAR